MTFDLDGLNSKKAASVDMEVGLRTAQDKPPSSWVKRWPRCAPMMLLGSLINHAKFVSVEGSV